MNLLLTVVAVGRYDLKMPDINESAMVDGVQASVEVIVLLTHGMMSRPFCHLEMRTALRSGATLLGVYESDERRGAVDFTPPDLRVLFTEIEFLPFRRREFVRFCRSTDLE